MNKQDIAVVAILFVALLGWMLHQNRVGRQRIEQSAAAIRAAVEEEQISEIPDGAGDSLATAQLSATNETLAKITPEAAAAAEVTTAAVERLPEELVTLCNSDMTVTLSTHGAAVKSVELVRYQASQADDSGVLTWDFSESPALCWEGLPGVAADADYVVVPPPTAASNTVTLALRASTGLEVERRVTLADNYRIEVQDIMRNAAAAPLASASTNWLSLGLFTAGNSRNDTLGGEACGTAEGAKVRHLNRDIMKAVGSGGGGCFSGGGQPLVPQATIPVPGEWRWVSLKSRFFTQILLPQEPASGFRIEAKASTNGNKQTPVGSISGAAAFGGFILQPGEVLERGTMLYMGPKKLAILNDMGHNINEVMEFGTFKWFCKLMVPTLNFFHRLLPNYGIAIILLTILVRVIFWPLTHKSTESMKRMQTIQPQLKELQTKYKDNPQKIQQETWRIYKENKVNPLSSCLPMLVQIPIFIALYTVLRSAVELRFASFLWIADLSEPENLLAGVLPIPLNILPILMAGTMALQSFLTPAGGDPAQQRMMMILMPSMMLFMFYGMPAALSLYWTVSQGISIIQMLMQRYRNKKAQGGGGGGGMTVEPPQTMTRQMRKRQAAAGGA